MSGKSEPLTKKCTRCGVEKKINSTNFYKSYSVLFESTKENRMCICKDCLLDLASKFEGRFHSDYKSLYELCRLLDVYYEKTLFESAKSQAGVKSNPYQIYFQKSLSLPQYKGRTFIDSEVFNKDDLELNVGSVDDNTIEFWGEGFTESEYDFLKKEFKNMIERYECDSYAQEVLFQEICFQRLDIKKKRQSGGSVDKELKTLQDLLGSANIKPVQESNALASEQVTFGTLIKKYENEKPIPEPLGEWKDADWIKKYVLTWFLGHFSKMMGAKNKYSEMYEEEVSKYTVSIDTEEDDD